MKEVKKENPKKNKVGDLQKKMESSSVFLIKKKGEKDFKEIGKE